MLGLPSTTDLALLGVVCAAIGAGMLYERHEGAASVKRVDQTAELKQAATDLANAKGTIDELQAKLAAIPPAKPAPILRLCIPSGNVRAVASATGTQPVVAPPAGESASGVPPGTTQLDIGQPVSDLERAAQVVAIYRDTTWDWAVKQAETKP